MMLTEEQQAITGFAASDNGNLVVEAGAGTGKTFCLLEVLKVLPQQSALVCAFNKPIAAEILAKLPTLPRTRLVHVKTFHAQGLAIVKKRFPSIVVASESTEEIINKVGTAASFKAKRAAVKILRTWKEQTTAPTQVPSDEEILDLGFDRDLFGRISDGEIQTAINAVRAGYALSLEDKAPKSIDFCDMVWLPLAHDLELTSRYKAVLVDELQDISPPQFELMRRLLVPGGRFIGVGDHWQQIYGWRGSMGSGAWALARKQFNATFLPLTVSFRCAENIVREAQKRVPMLRVHPDAVPGSVSHAKMSQLPRLLARGYSETIHTFILSRNNAALLDVAMFLWREKVPFQINAGREILEPLYGVLDGLRLTSTEDFKLSVQQWHAAEMFRAEKSGSTAWADRVDEQAKMLLAAGANTQPKKIKQLFQEMLKASGSGVLLSTVHKVKGLEADRVFLLKQTFACGRVIDDEFGDDRPPPQEEINIEYVAITRAREHLTWVDIDPQAHVVPDAEDELDRMPECTDGLSMDEISELFVYAERRALELMESDEALADRWMVRAEMLNKAMKEALCR